MWLLLLILPIRAATEMFYIGTYTTTPAGSQGIYAGTLNAATGQFGPLKLATKAVDPTFLTMSADKRFVFAAASDSVASYQVQPDGMLREISRQPSGANTCFVTTDRTGGELFSASYDAATVSAFPLMPDGHIGARTALVPFTGNGPNRERQAAAHPHSVCVDPENRHLYVCDLGADRIWILQRQAGGTLKFERPPVVVPPGTGPRHLAFSSDGRFVLVANELGVSTSVFARDTATGALTPVQTLSNLEPGWPIGTGSAEVVVHPSQRWLYVSTRLIDMLTVFAIDADPVCPLRLIERVPSPVKYPRSFAIDPTGRWVVVAGETDHRISVLRIDPATGRLTPTQQFAHVGSPVCVVFR